jgi:hypothetical protein
MITIVLKSWQEGLKKVELSLLQISLLNLSLREAKANVDALLDNKIIYFTTKDLNTATLFQEKATALGVVCDVENKPQLSTSL